MFRVILFAICGVMLFSWIYYIIAFISGKERRIVNEDKDFYLQQSAGTLKPSKTDLDYWYEKPHWYVLPNGEKINLSEYLTYEEYKSYSKEKLAKTIAEISSRLNKKETKENYID